MSSPLVELGRYRNISRELERELTSWKAKWPQPEPLLLKFSKWWSRKNQLKSLDRSLEVLQGAQGLRSVLNDLVGNDYANYSSAVTTIESSAYYKEKYGNIILDPPGSGSRRPDFSFSLQGNTVYFECKSPQLSNEEKQIQQIILKEVVEIPDLSHNIQGMALESLGMGREKKDSQLPTNYPGVFIFDLRYSFGKSPSDVEIAFEQPKGVFGMSGTSHISLVIVIENEWSSREITVNPSAKYPLKKSDL